MTLRFVPTPLAAPLGVPPERRGGVDPDLLAAAVPGPGVQGAVERLRDPRAVVVTTGQQPGLFTGPLYTIHKALSSAALARLLERRWGCPVVPVFWVAADDHDYAEATRAAWLRSDDSVAEGALPARPPDAPLTPLYREPLGPAIEPVVNALTADLPQSEFREGAVEWLRRHHRPEETVAGAFGGALAELIGPAGVVCVSSSHPSVKRAASGLLLRALEGAGELDQALARRAEELRGQGLDPGIAPGDGATLVMLEGSLGRDRLVADGGGFRTRRGGEAIGRGELERIAAEEPGRLSPNVLLRPVVESALFPTVAYLAGPAELRYLALTPPVYDRLGVPSQRPLPRWSGVLLEARVERVLQKFGIGLADLADPPGALEARLVRSELPPEAVAALARLRGAVESAYEALGRAAEAIDPTLVRPVRAAGQQALAGAADVERKLIQHLKKRRQTELSQLARERAAVVPNGRPQERVLNVAPFLARYGPGLVRDWAAAIEEWYAGALEGDRGPA